MVIFSSIPHDTTSRRFCRASRKKIVNFFFYNLKNLKKHKLHFLQAKKNSKNINFIFLQAKNTQKTWISFFASLKNLKKHSNMYLKGFDSYRYDQDIKKNLLIRENTLARTI